MENETKKSRIASVTTTRWVKFTIVTLALLAFVVWSTNAWWLLLMLLIIDIYITRFVRWDAWKKSENKTVRSIAEWVDAIVFALIAVYFINIYFFQNYRIPTSSLEKTLLVGDFLFVSKLAYGPRTPMTPLSFPLAQHTLPIINTRSYFERPQLPYNRLRGLRSIQRNDLVVFNFPAGDTVALKAQNENFHELVARHGRDVIENNEHIFGRIVYRPVDRRENYVKRCIAIPGDTLEIRNNVVYINGERQAEIPTLQFHYLVETNGQRFSDEFLTNLGVSVDDRRLIGDNPRLLHNLGFNPSPYGVFNPVYIFPLTREMYSQLKLLPMVNSIQILSTEENRMIFQREQFIFPLGFDSPWTISDFGPIWIPKRGATVALTLENLPLYERIIRNYERNQLEVRDGVIYINGEPAESYTFRMNYYWMMGDNRHNSADSRSFGFVPEDHIVGQPIFVWLSLDRDRGWFDGRIRFNRFFQNARQ